jgi:hypothetical protein
MIRERRRWRFDRSCRSSFVASAPCDPEVIMFLALFVIFLVCWVFGFVVFHVAGGLIHALLIVAVISLIWHFVGSRSVA